MSVDQIVVIADHSNLANHFDINSKLFLKFSSDGGVQIFARFNATACRFNECSLTKIIISICPDKIEILFIIYNYCPGNHSVVINYCKRPFVIFQIKQKFFVIHKRYISFINFYFPAAHLSSPSQYIFCS